MRILCAALAAVALVVIISGCGGGGGSSSPEAQVARAQLDAVYTYDISASSSKADSVDGILTVTITGDESVLSKQGIVELDDGERVFTSEIAAFFTQDASGSLFYAGEQSLRNGLNESGESQPLSVKSPLRSGDAWSSSAALEDGLTESWTSVVGEREAVSAGGTVFQAYPIETTRQSIYGTSVFTAWYAAEHPVPIMATGLMNGLRVTITLTELGRNTTASEDLDGPPAPPLAGGGDLESDIEFDTPPSPPIQWEQRGQDIAAIIREMLN